MLVDTVTASYDKFFFGEVGREIYDFFWSDYADWYVQQLKIFILDNMVHMQLYYLILFFSQFYA